MLRAPIVEKTVCKKDGNFSSIDCFEITDFETGEVICQNCGVVLQGNTTHDRLDGNMFTKSAHTFQGSNKSTLRFHDMGLATIIDKFNHDSAGKPISYKMRYEMKRIRLLNSRSHVKNTSDRNLRIALVEMEKLKEKLCLSNAIMERAAYIYRKAALAQLIRGRSIKGISGACVYIACREMDVARTIMDIAKNIQESRSSIARNYRILFQNLRLTVSVPDPIKCIVKIANNLELSENTKREAIHIFDTLKEKKLTAGKKPDAVAATVVYMAGIKRGANLSQQKISKVSGITGVTIRNRYKDYLKYIKLI
ncbi:MAG: transcription initiation factor IIB [Nitrosopumilus sp.]|nr:transcription initiation factor IIB [Nitrosopumilus sp.]